MKHETKVKIIKSLKRIGIYEQVKSCKDKMRDVYYVISNKNDIDKDNNQTNQSKKASKKNRAKNYIEVQNEIIDIKLKYLKKYCEENKKDKIVFSGITCVELRFPVLLKLAKEFPQYQFMALEKYKKTTLDKVDVNKYDFAYHEFGEAIERIDSSMMLNFFYVDNILGNEILKNDFVNSQFNNDIFTEFNSIDEVIKSKKYLEKAITNYENRHPVVDKNIIKFIVYKTYEFFVEFFDIVNPKAFILWNKFYALNNIIDSMCKERNIKTIYFEYGVLPGTFAFEDMGQMGESYPAVCCDEFLAKEVNDEDLDRAREILSHIKDSKLNRNLHVDVDFEYITSKIKKDRPTIFYAGQNDFESGLQPYDEDAKKFHSPFFKSSDEAALFLADIANKNNWNLIYKPHPIFKQLDTQKQLKNNIIQIDSGDINDLIDFADVTVTILSQTAYVASIREKPILLLGYNQLYGKSCAYEPENIEDIENTLKKAIEEGYTNDQKNAFVKHVGQLNKYYLFENEYLMNNKSNAQSIDKVVDAFNEIIK